MILKRKKLSPLAIYTLGFLGTAVLAFGCFAVFHKSFILNADGFLQHYPLLVKLRHIVGGLLRGEGIALWSSDIGLGNDLLGNMAIVLTDPFNYLAAAFPKQYIDIGYSIAVLLRMYTAGLTMMAFLKYRRFSGFGCAVGALSYAFCAWSVGVIRHGFFLLPLILFPLIILGIDKVFDGKKPYTLIFSVVMSLITYLYFAYMSAIFAFIYILVRYFLGEIPAKRSVRDFVKMLIGFIGYVLLACCIATPVIFSAIYTLLNALKSSGGVLATTLTIEEIIKFMPGLICNLEVTGHYSYIGASALMVMMIPLMLLRVRGKKYRVQTGIFFFCFLMVAFPLWGSLMNGFSYSVGRWCYVLSFFFVWSGVTCFEDGAQLQPREVKVVALWAAFLLLSILLGKVCTKVFSTANLAVGIWNVLFMAVFVLVYQKSKLQTFALLVANIGGMYLMVFSPFCGEAIVSYLDAGEPYRIYESSLLRAEKEIDDDDFWRVDYNSHVTSTGRKYNYTHTPANEGLYWGSSTLLNYLSSMDGNLLKFNRELANGGGYFRRTCVLSNDNRSRLDFLQGVRYFLGETGQPVYAGYTFETEGTAKDVEIWKSSKEASLGYIYSSAITEEAFAEYHPLDKEQALMQSAVISEEDRDSLGLKEATEDELVFDTRKIAYQPGEYTVESYGDHSFEVTESGQKMTLTIPECHNSEIYVEFKNLQKTPYTPQEWKEIRLANNASVYDAIMFDANYLNYRPYGDFECYAKLGDVRKRIIYPEGEPQGIINVERFLVNLGYCESVEGELTISFHTVGKYTFDELNVYAVSQEHFDEQADSLLEGRFRMTGRSANTISGKVTSKQDGLLYLSLLYHPGWRVSVDGVRTETYRTNLCFTGVPVSAGTHTITLTYRPIGFEISIILFGVGMSVVLLMLLKDGRKKRQNIQN